MIEEPQKLEDERKTSLTRILSKKAFERLSRAKLANPEAAIQAESYLIQIEQSGKIKKQVTEEQLKDILDVLSAKKKTKIKRK